MCSAVLSFVGAGKKGREVRSHFSAPPYGWPRDAIDAALISLFGSGHLRATLNGVAVPPRQLDQAKVPTGRFPGRACDRRRQAALEAAQAVSGRGSCLQAERRVGGGRPVAEATERLGPRCWRGCAAPGAPRYPPPDGAGDAGRQRAAPRRSRSARSACGQTWANGARQASSLPSGYPLSTAYALFSGTRKGSTSRGTWSRKSRRSSRNGGCWTHRTPCPSSPRS